MKLPSIKKTLDLFKVDETEIAHILESVRSQLPTTEALLIGKPQAGKSSIVRGLTGVGEEIVGQGFRPHTQYTKRYAYPSEDLPLLIFTDTVGLGDVDKNTEEIITELTTQLDIETKRARILILTVKINDFATDSLKNIAENLRKKYPQIPCLLVVTSLHELYPNLHSNHPEYPPNFPEIDRAFSEIKNTFSDLFDQATLIDFTLEEDGFIPMFYGLENLRDSLAELLPSAEAKTIHQLLDETVNSQLGNLYKNVARRYILAFSVMAVTLAAVPLPFATMPVLTALEVTMVGVLGRLYGQTINPSQAGGIISAIAGGFLAQVVGRELIKFIPGFGAVVAASWAGAYTWALGEGACAYFGDIVGGKKPNPEKIKAVMKDAFKDAKKQLKINQEN
ncbi:MAG: DUF697 domain-containing protein [Cyanobacteria bacterium]|nr:DUF697 domain-containing protein [Cyanobacteria bacterium CG_2015-16_32_12]NCO76824.1 DUF697 domain-containing protein [Cyanobacteria bacterium CG_2015-22_32_23]NCQ05903.1 DUF697 domain-containing protein [Cyanobacteria bacterium CG_2015-09_32_10]